eukprot:GGOE01024662.1.p3 GENE.GGOE01024662.1~~GGOE01024662.1.p3  ORF type:complete len:107 (+),score=11.32 GGOE01024662.1:358-678(+)
MREAQFRLLQLRCAGCGSTQQLTKGKKMGEWMLTRLGRQLWLDKNQYTNEHEAAKCNHLGSDSAERHTGKERHGKWGGLAKICQDQRNRASGLCPQAGSKAPTGIR